MARKPEIYVSTDVEADGPIPGPYSLLSFASAAYTADKKLISTFSRNLVQLPGASMHPVQDKFWSENPEAWAACRTDLVEPLEAMKDYLVWLKSLPGTPIFTGFPAAYDFMFVQWYLHAFAGESPFGHAALDIKSFMMALMDKTFKKVSLTSLPRAWFDDLPHTHIAVDDAIEQGALFCNVLAWAKQMDLAPKLLELARANVELPPQSAKLLELARAKAESPARSAKPRKRSKAPRLTAFLGVPGAGKSTLARAFAEQDGFLYLHAGRYAWATGLIESPRASRAEVEAVQGLSTRIIEAIRGATRQKRHVFLDGFPRTVEHAQSLLASGIPFRIVHLTFPGGNELDLSVARQVKRFDERSVEMARADLETKARKAIEQERVVLDFLRANNANFVELDASGTPEDAFEQFASVIKRSRKRKSKGV